jgi:phosphatidate cytidylyltransferase
MNLLLRLASAVVLLPAVLTVVHLGGWWAFGLCAVVSILALWEYGHIILKDDWPGRIALIAIGTVFACGATLMESPALALVSIQFGGLLLAILFVLRTGDFDTAWSRMATTGFGLIYIAVGCYSLVALREFGDYLPSKWEKPSWLYIALIVTWANDTLAYFTGRAIGKRKFYEKVSPNKTWEGFLGGAIGAVIMLFVIRAALPDIFGHFTAVDLLFIGIPSSILGPLGDLAESLLKRNYGVKDSGNTIPGHGGMLDRVDALFFVVPWVLLYGLAIRPLFAQ